PITAQSLERHYHIDGSQLERHYKEHLSDYREWDQLDHADKWLLIPENMGTHLSIDETSLSNGELYTIVTNKAAKGRKGALVAIVEGTKSDEIIQVLDSVPETLLEKVEEVTLDMADSMRKIVRSCFPKATRVIDRFHVQKLAFDAMQEMRIAHRWDAINQETNDKENAKLDSRKYKSPVFENGDTRKQLLARSRYLLFKSPDKWTDKQKFRSRILFEQYPDLKEAFSLTHSLRMIYNKNTVKDAARLSLAKWYNQVTDADFKSFNTISATVYTHYEEILNFFTNRSTNASAESFNAKIKAFRASLRGVVDIKFFLYRLAKIYG
ncbi:MAG: transposase, partial [Bacteroidales bacterium]|nr:transposase [Bacteroidales bacterium]